MSWFFEIPSTPIDTFEDGAREAFDKALPNIRASNPEGEDQAHEALDIAISLVYSGVIGEGKASASLQGHANPRHEPRSGYVNDQVTITVRQV